jgi:DNA-binding transcriptional LysR family regulator
MVASDRPVRCERNYWAVWPNRAHDMAGVQTFIQWLQVEAAAFKRPANVASGSLL